MALTKRKRTQSKAGSKTYLLQGSYSSNNAKLDFRSHLFLSWMDRWTACNGGLKSPDSGLIRRALILYSKHIAALPPSDAAFELRLIKQANGLIGHLPHEQEVAEQRLASCVTADGSLLPFELVFHGQEQLDRAARLIQHLEQVEANHKPIKSRLKKPATTTQPNDEPQTQPNP